MITQDSKLLWNKWNGGIDVDIKRINDLKKNFKSRNIEVKYFEILEDVKSYILNIIPVECSNGIGRSITL